MKIIKKKDSAQNNRYIKRLVGKRILALAFTFAIYGLGMSQSHSNKMDGSDYEKADAQLNETYRLILNEYRDDIVFISNLREAQRIWILHRDAELRMKFPAENKEAQYGSIYPDCVSAYLTELTSERTLKLQIWLDGTEEGDVCSGSIKNSDK